ncbi:MAG TPA: ferritin-like domain-containing protein [Ohtaekwangia sp.]|nr:ferritin-like domain-containing protein [Ohtaekwangia sp.]
MAKTAKTSAKKTSRRATIKPQTQDEISSALMELFIDEIKDIYWAEKHLTKALPKLEKAATSSELKKAFAKHQKQTDGHVSRLEKVFKLLGRNAQGKKCDAMVGLVEEASGIIEYTEKGTATRDVGLIMAAQKVEHYEIAAYGSLCQLAKTLQREDIKNILGATLAEEKLTDELLTTIAEEHVNYDATLEEA